MHSKRLRVYVKYRTDNFLMNGIGACSNYYSFEVHPLICPPTTLSGLFFDRERFDFFADSASSKGLHTRPNEHHLITSLVKEDLLMVIKLCIDWLRVNPEATVCEVSFVNNAVECLGTSVASNALSFRFK